MFNFITKFNDNCDLYNIQQYIITVYVNNIFYKYRKKNNYSKQLKEKNSMFIVSKFYLVFLAYRKTSVFCKHIYKNK